jgi:hypothetical protein
MNKKGFIFTFISVTLVSVILIAFLIQYTSRTKVEIERTNTEIETMNSFVKSLNEDYFSRALRISGNQAILALLYCMDTSIQCDENIENALNNNDGYLGENINQIESYIINAMIDKEFETSFGQGDHGPVLELMEDDGIIYNLPNVLDEVKNLAEFTGINLEINSDITGEPFKNGMSVSQTDPWNIKVTMILSYIVSNKDGSISWNYDEEPKTIEAFIPISNLREPIYMIERGNKILVKETPYKIEENELIDRIGEHIANTYFVQCDQSPDFLQRMTNGGYQLQSEHGIESLINFQSPSQSAIDFQYIFRQQIQINPEDLRQIDESGYYIDNTHTPCYGF